VQAAAPGNALMASEARVSVVRYLKRQMTGAGGFKGRGDGADLYYTLFGMACLKTLGVPLPERLADYLSGFGVGDGLDFVHLTCLARCLGDLQEGEATDGIAATLQRIEYFRARDGGYATMAGAQQSTVYAVFLGCLAYESLGVPLPGLSQCLHSVAHKKMPDGSYGSERDVDWGTTPVTAAAVVLLEHHGLEVGYDVREWLLRQARRGGGFAAGPGADSPDLLSTATALYALRRLGVKASSRAEHMLFVERQWQEDGGFRGHSRRDGADCEYTFYGLLALGCLAEGSAGRGGGP